MRKIGLVLSLITACTRNADVTLSAKQFARYVDASNPVYADFEQTLEFTGAVEPRQFVNLNFAVPGRISSCRLKEGQVVSKNEEICRLDESVVSLEVRRAEQALAAASRIAATQFVDKQRRLFEAGVIGQGEFEQLRIQSEGARASQTDAKSVYDLALRKKSEHILRAPWDGRVAKLFMRAGQLTSPELPVAIVSGQEGLQIKVELSANAFSHVQLGSEARLEHAAVVISANESKWSVAEKTQSIHPVTQTFTVVLVPNNSDAKKSSLAPGMLVSGVLQNQKIPNALIVPQASLYSVDAQGHAQLFVVEDGRLKLKSIGIGATNGLQTQVLTGLTKNEIVVTKIAPDFMDDMLVEVVK